MIKMNNTNYIFSIFGATGDLTHRKLLPALYYLERENYLKENFSIICISRKQKTNEDYRKEVLDSIKKYSRIKIIDETANKLVSRIHYHVMEFSNENDYTLLKQLMERISGLEYRQCERIFYLASHPSYFSTIVNNLKKARLTNKEVHKAYNRVMFEKPFGYDLTSARALNKSISKVFTERQIYRIDHYMAKELVQNLIVLRFANSIFEPLWNTEYIKHVQITVAESIGVEGRGDYYDNAGAIRDVMQNHMMQLLTLVAMEPPKSLNADDLRNAKIKVLKSIKFSKNNIHNIAVTGQYSEGEINGKKVLSYTNEPEVRNDSTTETYAALKLEVNNIMWKGVPFYLRTGKRLKERATEIVIVYKKAPFDVFQNFHLANNMLIIRVQPYEGITLRFNAKVPGNKVTIEDVNMEFCHECKFGPNSPEAYERLLYDVMIGDQTLFTSWKEVEYAWRIFDDLVEFFKNKNPFKYRVGSWGPIKADKLIESDGFKWVEPTRPAYADLLERQQQK